MKDSPLLTNILTTIIILWILNEKFDSTYDEWQLIAYKGYEALKANGITKLNDYFALIDKVD